MGLEELRRVLLWRKARQADVTVEGLPLDWLHPLGLRPTDSLTTDLARAGIGATSTGLTDLVYGVWS